MGMPSTDAFKIAAKDSDMLGKRWAQKPTASVPFELRSDAAVILERVTRFVDDTDPGWELEHQFNDANFTLQLHCEWMMRQARNHYLVEWHNSVHTQLPDADQVRRHLMSTLRSADILDAISQVPFSVTDHWMKAFSSEIAQEWIERGGSSAPAALYIAVVIGAEALAMLVDPTSTYGYSDAGLPNRLHQELICEALEEHTIDQVLSAVSCKIAFELKTWDDFDLLAVIDRAVAAMKPVVAAQRAAEAAADKFAAELASADSSLKEWQKFHHRPLISPYGLSPDEAEQWVCDWMLHMGAKGSKVTQYVGDGGIDVQAERYLAQVKMYAGSVGIASIREFAGVTFLDEDERRALFFTGCVGGGSPRL